MIKNDELKSCSANVEAEMFEATFNFWFNDEKHIRSPFPLYIRDSLTKISIEKFLEWTTQIKDDAKKDLNDEILAEKFEEIIFENALKLVLTEDEKLTIKYPFLLRIDDRIFVKGVNEEEKESKVIDRFVIKKDDNVFLKVKLQNLSSGEKWETEFELPE